MLAKKMRFHQSSLIHQIELAITILTSKVALSFETQANVSFTYSHIVFVDGLFLVNR